MKKKTNLQTAPEEGEAKGEGEPERKRKRKRTPVLPQETVDRIQRGETRQRGPQKEKTQVTVRIDKDLMNEAYAQMKEDNTRITDIIERGIVLALAEARHDMPAWTKQVRFVLANATRQQQVWIRGLAIAMVEPLLMADGVIEKGEGLLTIWEDKFFETVKWFLETRNKQPHANACLEYYSRYGKSAEEIAKLGRL